MARGKKKRNKVDGWLILDKPVGLSSTQALGRVKWFLNPQKAGHAGTLDPLASGLLPLAFGEATKTVPYVMDGRKVYRFTVRWGVETDTDDTEGAVIATSDVLPDADDIRAVLPEFTGEILQTPPKFSAIKVDGARAYDLARAGEEVELEARPIEIHRLDLVEMPDAETTVFEAECGKGTYVRALARDIGRRLGTHGHVCALRRVLVGPFDEEDMVTLDELEEIAAEAREELAAEAGDAIEVADEEADGEAPKRPAPLDPDVFEEVMLPVETALADLPELAVDTNAAARLRRGQGVILRGRDAPVAGCEVFATCRGQLVALGQVERGELRPIRVFNL
ncbi:tRNA pseudouridine55 synthase [Rhodobium orientis]|uniref:tRNA pseudouridine synthase B n=1 Tax=Rhodobium orientis TaxID=34017 RepID=A0A327JIF8_9HYPH|nr:tRNA pseudouridine(55) synthase TruB [Rhodobium orientis]MBB4304520.1 tRNA pseudouridine55 synthase [Rhodobium orientis]MBK5948111.1 tRNA pseudouridine(55) synthase TruB [Rhodobium orientis]RAI26190.1 tRNA pseudouridine(55) synthase TruB [Rhodobium orientis]